MKRPGVVRLRHQDLPIRLLGLFDPAVPMELDCCVERSHRGSPTGADVHL